MSEDAEWYGELLTLFTRVHKLMGAAVDQAMSEHGVRLGQNLILARLWDRDGQAPGEIAGHWQVSTPTIVTTARRMEAAGLITRRRDPHDARLVRFYLTDRGRAARQPVQQARQRLAVHATATLTDAERRHLRSALTKIIKQLE
jgi:MarR family transcriptional regulator, organic hydroperoxide resistance regulator